MTGRRDDEAHRAESIVGLAGGRVGDELVVIQRAVGVLARGNAELFPAALRPVDLPGWLAEEIEKHGEWIARCSAPPQPDEPARAKSVQALLAIWRATGRIIAALNEASVPVAWEVAEHRDGRWLFGDDWSERCGSPSAAVRVAQRWSRHGAGPVGVFALVPVSVTGGERER